MEKRDYNTQNKKIKEFENVIFSLKNGEKIKDTYCIAFEGPWNNRIPVFFFNDTLLTRGERQICYDLFTDYFPEGDGKIASL